MRRPGYQPLLLRTYLVLAGGLLLVAMTLDVAFRRLVPDEPRTEDAWIQATFRLVEERLRSADGGSPGDALEKLERDVGMPIRIIGSGDIVAPAGLGEAVQSYRDEQGRTYYMSRSGELDGVIRIGPLAGAPDSAWPLLLPALFYASIFAVVALWLRPLLKDLDLLTMATQRFAADYRQPLKTAGETRQLTDLAANLDEMSRRTAHLIENQKELTAALSHEMRTPLARIRFGLAVAGSGADAGVQQQLGAIGNDVQLLDGLISRLLDYARLDHPGLAMTWQQVPVVPWLEEVIARSASGGKSVEAVHAGGERAASMDAKLMELAVSNLIVNACRYARSCVTVAFDCSAGNCRLVVSDDGQGVPAAQRDKAFRAFSRLESGGERDVGGFGLGLAIVARVASLHGGRATVDASPTLGGARFTIEWPCTEN